MKLGVAITTHNREEVTKNTVARWKQMLPKDAVLVIVDDASDRPYRDATFRFEKNVGIARAKNKCLELLEDLGCDEFFLSDNDCYPQHKKWWEPYVNSPEPHLSYQFLDLVGKQKLRDIEEIYRDLSHVAYTGQRGCLLYYNRACLESVGGFDPIYGRGMYEHSDLANRIHAAGLTTWRYADVTNSHKIWHSMDEYVQVTRSFPQEEQSELAKRNARIHDTRRAQGCQSFVPYRQVPEGKYDVLLTTLLTRNGKQRPHPDLLATWLESVERGGYNSVVLADELRGLPRGYSSSVIHVLASKTNVHYQRWLHVYHFLRDNPDVRWVWFTDGTDVEVLGDPFAGMLPSVLYVGGGDQRFSTGIVGGHRAIVQEFAQKIVTIYNDTFPEDVEDVTAFNKVAHGVFGSRLIYGPEVAAKFRTKNVYSTDQS